MIVSAPAIVLITEEHPDEMQAAFARYVSEYDVRLARSCREALQTTHDIVAEGGTATRGNWIKSAREGRFKVHHTRMGGEQRWIGGPGVDLVLYDLEADPGETVNVVGEHP